MPGILKIDDLVMAVMLVVGSSEAEPEEVLEVLPEVMKRLEEQYKRLQPGYVVIHDPTEHLGS